MLARIFSLFIVLNEISGKLEFARRAGGQVVTGVVRNRSQPDPLGIVLWRGKLEFDGECGIDSLRRGRVSRPAPNASANSAGRETRPLQKDDDRKSGIRWRFPGQ